MKRFKIWGLLCVATLCLSLTSCFDFLKDLEETLSVTDLDPTTEEMATFIYGKWEVIKAGEGTAEDFAGNDHADDSDSFGDNRRLESITLTASKAILRFSEPIPVREDNGETTAITFDEIVCDFNGTLYGCFSYPYKLYYNEHKGEYLWHPSYEYDEKLIWGELEIYGVENDNDEIERVDYMLLTLNTSTFTYELEKVD